ncbi:pilus assembly protein TadG-related protein [Pseudoroseicyclus sp. CXY001]|uniref:pilus assembly protein TadG-related protein n=1 Tax=Pseudoroseicyclus sp. CXY001 TaxID=3242492 RepID=UPI003570A56E
MRPTSILRAARRAGGRLGRFHRAEDGSMIIFSLFIILMMLIVGGVAVDVMRAEAHRQRLQTLVDRATLAAADLNQTLDPEEVVRDYFTRAGLLEDLVSVDVSSAFNRREVTVLARTNVPTTLTQLVGIEEFNVPAVATATESVTDLEILLVLDVSGSMGDYNKLEDLKDAAQEFVNTIFDTDTEGRVSMGMVPFNGQVNLGRRFFEQYNTHDYGGVAENYCIDLPPEAYASLDLSTDLPMPATGFYDSYSTTYTYDNYYSPSDNRPRNDRGYYTNSWCPPMTENQVLVPSDDRQELLDAIENLHAIGATSINAGMRWGMELMDPGSAAMITELNGGTVAGQIRPLAYDAPDAGKIVVLMTDGEHFPEERLNDGWRAGASPIFRSSDGYYSIYHPGVSGGFQWYVPHKDFWMREPWQGSNPNYRDRATSVSTGYRAQDMLRGGESLPARIGNATRQDWQDIWEDMRVQYVAWQFYARAFGTSNYSRSSVFTTQMDSFRTQTSTATMDNQLQALCTDAKDQGVAIYGISFMASEHGAGEIFDCASSPSHFYPATGEGSSDGTDIMTVFQSIAGSINTLRLTQ